MALNVFRHRPYGLHAIGAWPSARLARLEAFSAPPDADVLDFATLDALADGDQVAAGASRGAVIRPSGRSVDTIPAQLAGTTLIGATRHQCGETFLRGDLHGGPVR